MSNADQDGWSRVKGRLRAEVGDDVYSSWFARMDLEAIEDGTVRLSVPTRFLKSWIQSHYAERVLACWQAERRQVGRIELIVRSAVLRSTVAKPKPRAAETVRRRRQPRQRPATAMARPLPAGDPAVHEALGGSPLDAAADLRQLRGRPLQHAGACRRQAGRRRAARRRR